jgi:glycyl-tRNA synthetase beta subunit
MACGMNLELGWEGLGRIVRSKDRSQDVSAQDEIHIDVKLLPVLSEEQMREILRRVLEADGWSKQEDGSLTKNIEGVVAQLEPDASRVVLRAVEKKTIIVTERRRFDKDTNDEEIDEQLEKGLTDQMERAKKAQEEALSRVAVAKLLGAEPSLREQVQTALNKVYREALEQRAKQLGSIEWVKEQGDPGGNYEVTLVVKA